MQCFKCAFCRHWVQYYHSLYVLDSCTFVVKSPLLWLPWQGRQGSILFWGESEPTVETFQKTGHGHCSSTPVTTMEGSKRSNIILQSLGEFACSGGRLSRWYSEPWNGDVTWRKLVPRSVGCHGACWALVNRSRADSWQPGPQPQDRDRPTHASQTRPGLVTMNGMGLSLSEICCLFCCPPCPSKIAAKLAFLPPEPTYTFEVSSSHSLHFPSLSLESLRSGWIWELVVH